MSISHFLSVFMFGIVGVISLLPDHLLAVSAFLFFIALVFMFDAVIRELRLIREVIAFATAHEMKEKNYGARHEQPAGSYRAAGPA